MIKEIAKYIVDAGISNTESGNWHITFDEINSLFGTNLPTDADMLGEIQNHIIENYPDMVRSRLKFHPKSTVCLWYCCL